MLARCIFQFVFFSLSAVFCLYVSSFDYADLIQYQIGNADFVCGLFTAVYIVSVMPAVKCRSVDLYIALRKGCYRKWIEDKERSIIVNTAVFTAIFFFANCAVKVLQSADWNMGRMNLGLVQMFFLFAFRFLFLGEVLLFLSILYRKTTIAYILAFALSMAVDSRMSSLEVWGAIWPQYHLNSGHFAMAVLYFSVLLSAVGYLNHSIYLQKDVF